MRLQSQVGMFQEKKIPWDVVIVIAALSINAVVLLI